MTKPLSEEEKAARIAKRARQDLAFITPTSNLAPKAMRSKSKFKARKRDPNEALPYALDLFSRPMYDGKELKDFCDRPHAMDAMKLPSLINGERIYRRNT